MVATTSRECRCGGSSSNRFEFVGGYSTSTTEDTVKQGKGLLFCEKLHISPDALLCLRLDRICLSDSHQEQKILLYCNGNILNIKCNTSKTDQQIVPRYYSANKITPR